MAPTMLDRRRFSLVPKYNRITITVVITQKSEFPVIKYLQYTLVAVEFACYKSEYIPKNQWNSQSPLRCLKADDRDDHYL